MRRQSTRYVPALSGMAKNGSSWRRPKSVQYRNQRRKYIYHEQCNGHAKGHDNTHSGKIILFLRQTLTAACAAVFLILQTPNVIGRIVVPFFFSPVISKLRQ